MFGGKVPQFLAESNDDWEELLTKFNNDKSCAMELQNHIVDCITKNINKNIDDTKHSILVTERSVLSSVAVFCNNMLVSGIISDEQYTSFLLLCSNTYHMYNPDALIYLHSTPMCCIERIKERNRDSDSSITMHYLQGIHDRHEEWINHSSNNSSIQFGLHKHHVDSKEENYNIDKCINFIFKPLNSVKPYIVNTDNMTSNDIQTTCIDILLHLHQLLLTF
jgi:deoxycitidine kinase